MGSGTAEVLMLSEKRASEAKDFCSARKTFPASPGSGSILLSLQHPLQAFQKENFSENQQGKKAFQ